jgi:hypothetical protein
MSGTVTYTYQAATGFQPMGAPPGWVIRSTDGAFVPCVLANMDYQAFLAWIAAGNTAPSGWTGPTNPTEGSS